LLKDTDGDALMLAEFRAPPDFTAFSNAVARVRLHCWSVSSRRLPTPTMMGIVRSQSPRGLPWPRR